jgi:hypothetical protein
MPKKRQGKNGRIAKHDNNFAFKHNPKSKKSEVIAQVTHSGLCHRCSDKIAWKKKYRKYKPLKRSGKCYSCEQPAVKRAYHTICGNCAKQQNCCAWCKLDFSTVSVKRGVVVTREERSELAAIEGKKLEKQLGKLRERDRRSAIRQLNRSDTEDDGDYDDDNIEEDEGVAMVGDEGGNQEMMDDDRNDRKMSAMDVDDDE